MDVVIGKTMEDVRNRVEVRLANSKNGIWNGHENHAICDKKCLTMT